MSQNVTHEHCNIGVASSGPGSVSVSGDVNVGDTVKNQGVLMQISGSHVTIHHDSPGTENLEDRIELQEFHVPNRNESFFGRDQELLVLEEWFTSGEHKMTVVCGCAGYGKTELVKQFVRRLKDGGTVARVLWMDAETPDTLLQSFRDLAQILRLPQLDDVTLIKSVFSRIESAAGRSVMVFDNAENRKNIQKFESEGKTMCVVTSRMQDWDDVPTLPLTPLLAAGALALLLDKLPEADEQELSALAAALSHVPLALHVAAGYVRQEMRALGHDFNLPNYVKQIQDSCDSLINTPLPESSANTYDKTLSQTIQISLKKIQNSTLPNSELAWKILHVSAYLYSEKIIVDDLLCILCLNIDSKSDILRACTLLANYSLITFGEFIKIHRFIQDTLVTFQNQNNLRIFHTSCLQILFVKNRTCKFHKNFILNRVGNNSGFFKKFYIENKKKILIDQVFLENLISMGCNIALEKILTDLGGRAAGVINKLYLLHKAVCHRQHDVLKLLLARGAHVNCKDDDNNTALHLAVDRIDLYAVQILTSHGANVNATDRICMSVLQRLLEASGYAHHIARSEEACAVLRFLLERRARTDVLTSAGETLLQFAAVVNCADLVRCLLCEFRLDVHAVDRNNWTALNWVVGGWDLDRGRKLRTVACLLELDARRAAGNSGGETSAQLAHRRGLEYMANYLDNHSLECLPQQDSLDDVLTDAVGVGDLSSLTSKLDELGEHAVQVIEEHCLLHVAVRHEQYDVLELLLTRGANVNCKDNNYNTALHYAADMVDMCAVQILTSHNADVNATNDLGWSVLQRLIASSRYTQHTEVCAVLRWLVGRGARTNLVTPDGETLLHRAAKTHNADLVRCLVQEFHLDVNAVDADSRTPLYYVRYLSSNVGSGVRTAACLLELGASRGVVDRFGRTPAQDARSFGHWCYAIWLDYGQVCGARVIDCGWRCDTCCCVAVLLAALGLVLQGDESLYTDTAPGFIDLNSPSNDSDYDEEQNNQSASQHRRYKCNVCTKAFNFPSQLEQHTRSHSGDKPYKCSTCHKTFTRSDHLNTHKLIHSGEKPHECDVCLKTFTHHGSLKRHILIHTGKKPHECNECHKTFNQKSSLITHKHRHNNVRPHKCSVCSYTCTTAGDLRVHMRTHTGERPYHCHVCQYKTTRASHLKTHITTHTGKRPYTCSLCQMTFTTSSQLNRHKLKFHNQQVN